MQLANDALETYRIDRFDQVFVTRPSIFAYNDTREKLLAAAAEISELIGQGY